MAIWPLLVLGQIFGAMPLINVKNPSLSALHFEWKSLRTFYSIAIAALLSSYSILLVWKILTVSIEFDLIGLFLRVFFHFSYIILFRLVWISYSRILLLCHKHM